MSETIPVNEIFRSLQGEGALTGVPSVFVRTSGCNLRCAWCDTPDTSWQPTGKPMSVADIVTEIARYDPIRHVVLTGGEPLIAPHVETLAAEIKGRGLHLTIETAGTVYRPLPMDLVSISPKLANSTPGCEAGAWAARHEKRRIDHEVVRRLMALAAYQLKFVVGARDDLDEVQAIVRAVDADPDRVLLMPEGRDVERLDAVAAWLAPRCLGLGYRFCDRLQIRLYGDTRGT